MTTAIKLKNVTKSFGKLVALEAIDLDIETGEVFGVIGPDGAGKTTLFRLITSLMLPDSGEIRVLGHAVWKDFKQVRRKIGYMPGRFSLYQDLTVEENLKFYATVFGTTVEQNYQLIRDVYSRIEPFRKRLARNLSGGMKQKLALSCALIHRPELLILDEPTTGVDAVSRREFWELLRTIQQEGITVVVSTPYMDEAMRCNRVAFLQNGQILAVDEPHRIIDTYSKKIYSIRSEDLYQLVMDLRDYPDVNSALLFGHEVHYTSRADNAEVGQLRRYLQQKGHQSIRIEMIEPGIEDAFLDLMKEQNEHG
jgi:ABC-type multidrug transport system ATPase subunit